MVRAHAIAPAVAAALTNLHALGRLALVSMASTLLSDHPAPLGFL